MIRQDRISPTLSGIAGEYMVAAELSRRGYVASLTLRNTRGIDILVSNQNATKSVGVQVKTNQRSKKEWILSKKTVDNSAKNLVFVFVRLNGLKTPEFYIVPCRDATKFAKRFHDQWMSGVRRDGLPRKDGAMRKFRDDKDKYLDRWDFLGID